MATEEKYIELFLEPVRKCKGYKPKFGESQNEAGVSLDGFLKLYGSDQVSMSFKSHSIQYEFSQLKFLFEVIFNHTVTSVKTQLTGNAMVLKGDSRDLSDYDKNLFDTVITSPPYPNCISYIRELRPYMYWAKFLHNGNDAGALDWQAIGGTRGIATSNLKDWKPKKRNTNRGLFEFNVTALCEK